MTRYEIDNELTALYRELRIVNSMDEVTACRCYNVDCKNDRIETINRDIKSYECAMQELDFHENRDLNYCRTADAPYLCW